MFITPLLAAATLMFTPEVISDCRDALGRGTLTWSGASGPVEVRVGAPDGVSLTGVREPAGDAVTGYWVTGGMPFYLVTTGGAVEASTTARVSCGADPGGASRRGESFFPLQVGNTWVYRLNSRSVTSAYVRRAITGTEQQGSLTYYLLSSDGVETARLREDASGRIWRLTGTASGPAEELVLDPAAATRAPFRGVIGTFPDAASVVRRDVLIRVEDTYLPGVGLARSETLMLTGSSGGFVSGLELVEARLQGGVRLDLPARRLSLAIESDTLDVTGRNVTNCAVPSYCVACGLIGADAPGTYKPCAQARVDASASGSYTVELELADAAGQVVYRAPASPASAGDLLRYVQLPLYSQPNRPFPPGVYRLTGQVRRAGDVVAAASLDVRID